MNHKTRSKMPKTKRQAPARHCGIIIPVYNSTAYLDAILDEIQSIETQLADWRFTLLIVDDGSTPPVPNFVKEHLNIVQLRQAQNGGKGTALKRGFSYFLAKKEIEAVVTLDADMQHPPEYIPHFLKAFQENEGMVITGSRNRDPRIMPLHRILSNYLTSQMIGTMIRQKVEDSQCGYRLYTRQALEAVELKENRFHLESEFLVRSGWKGFAIGHVPIPTIYNDAPSAIRNLPDTWNFITLICKLLIERARGHA